MQNEIENAVKVIQEGGVILYPTDTVWGLGCDPQNEKAVLEIAKIKQRTDSKQFIVLVPNEQLLNKYVKEIPEICYDLIDLATEPLTIIYPVGQNVAKNILAPDKSLAVRITKHEFCSKLMQKLKSGLISTSANISGKPTPLQYNDIDSEILNSVDYIVNLEKTRVSTKASQIIKIGMKGEVQIIRK